MKTIFLFLIILSAYFSWGQSTQEIEYLYDAAGNRYYRHVIIIPALEKKSYYQDTLKTIKSDTIKDVISNCVVLVYPNPANNILNIDIKGKVSHGKIMLADLNGKLLKEIYINQSYNTINVSKLLPSTYFITIYINNKRSEWKIIKN